MEKQSLRHATLLDIGLWLLRRYHRFRVTGDSMRPLLAPPQEVLLSPSTDQTMPPQPGDIVVAYHPQQPHLRIVKRVLFVESDGRCYLQGDNAIASSDSRQFGLVPSSYIAGKVICLFP